MLTKKSSQLSLTYVNIWVYLRDIILPAITSDEGL